MPPTLTDYELRRLHDELDACLNRHGWWFTGAGIALGLFSFVRYKV